MNKPNVRRKRHELGADDHRHRLSDSDNGAPEGKPFTPVNEVPTAQSGLSLERELKSIHDLCRENNGTAFNSSAFEKLIDEVYSKSDQGNTLQELEVIVRDKVTGQVVIHFTWQNRNAIHHMPVPLKFAPTRDPECLIRIKHELMIGCDHS